MMRNTLRKRISAGVLTLAVAVAGFISMPNGAKAEETTPVKYQKVAFEDFEDKVGETAPAYVPEDATDNTGYLFAGWYEIGDGDVVGNSIASAEGITADYVYAKFVPSYLTGIACQVDLNADASKRNMRVVSLVHSQDYIATGFNVYGRYDADAVKDGINETEWVMYEYSENPENPNKAQGKTVYQGLYQYTEENGKQLKYPEDVFGADAANDFYFTTVSIAGIPEAYHDATMAVQPYWITKDGTYVEGMGEFNRINDYQDKIVNVSVNLKEAGAIAAGMLDITVPSEFSYTAVEVEKGRVFAEMTSSQNSNIIKCVGNVKELVDNTDANEVYVNLRFKVGDLSTLTKGATEFTVTTKGFCNVQEEYDIDVKAWNVKY